LNYIAGRLWYGNLKRDWFGEDGAGDADAAVQEIEDYKKLRPVKQFPGYALSAFESEFPDIDKVRATFWEGDPEKTYRERAYFANTEAEARKILEDWQDFLRTREDGLYMKFLDFMAGKSKARDDIAF